MNTENHNLKYLMSHHSPEVRELARCLIATREVLLATINEAIELGRICDDQCETIECLEKARDKSRAHIAALNWHNQELREYYP